MNHGIIQGGEGWKGVDQTNEGAAPARERQHGPGPIEKLGDLGRHGLRP